MVHSRSPSWLIPAASHDGFSTDVHHHDSFTTAARGGFTPAPACRCRRTYLHLCNSMVTVDHSVFYIRNSSSLQDTLTPSPRPLSACTKTECVREGPTPALTTADLEQTTSARVDSYNNDRLIHR